MCAQEKKPYHIPVLEQEVLQFLAPADDQIIIDATFGGGGHSRAILTRAPGCTVVGMDWDLYALETNGLALQEEFGDRLKLVWGNFSQIDKKIKKVEIEKADAILADFGTSFYQLTERAGFSIYKDTPLDMRMSPAHQQITAAYILNNASFNELVHILQEFGQEHDAKRIVRVIEAAREQKPLKTTQDLVRIVEQVKGPKKAGIHPATKTFQALRIAVNNELHNIEAFLVAALRVLKPGGRLVCITFHSLEDRIVKHFFKNYTTGHDARAELLTFKPIVPSEEEIKRNPASRSAKLRALKMNL